MTRRKFSREFKIEAVKLVADRGVAAAKAALNITNDAEDAGDWTRIEVMLTRLADLIHRFGAETVIPDDANWHMTRADTLAHVEETLARRPC